VGFILAAILTVIGTLLLLASLAGVAFGVYMAADPKTRESGKLFAVWWVPAAAAASGLFMRDVTFTIGALCFLVAGAVFTFEDGKARTPTAKRTNEKREDSEKTTKENSKTDDEAAS
jgi:phosphotransferase system  glucose/maltose/N-acetylglucosamine-specific IIC component